MYTEEGVSLRRFSVYALDLEVLPLLHWLFRMEEDPCEDFRHVTVS